MNDVIEKQPPTREELIRQLEILREKLDDPALTGDGFNKLRDMVAEIQKNIG